MLRSILILPDLEIPLTSKKKTKKRIYKKSDFFKFDQIMVWGYGSAWFFTLIPNPTSKPAQTRLKLDFIKNPIFMVLRPLIPPTVWAHHRAWGPAGAPPWGPQPLAGSSIKDRTSERPRNFLVYRVSSVFVGEYRGENLRSKYHKNMFF